MNLTDAISKILKVDNARSLDNRIVHNMLSDYGVFKDTPKLRLITKSALEYGLWKMIINESHYSAVLTLKSKLVNDGFSDDIICLLINSLFSENTNFSKSRNDVKNTIEGNQIAKKKTRYNPTTDKANAVDFMSKLFGNPIYQHSHIKSLHVVTQNSPLLKNVKKCLYINASKFDDFGIGLAQFKIFDCTNSIQLKYKLLINKEINQRIKICAYIFTSKKRFDSKHIITELDPDSKAVSNRESNIKPICSISQIGYIVLSPEYGDISYTGDISYIDNIFNHTDNKITTTQLNIKDMAVIRFNGITEMKNITGGPDLRLRFSNLSIYRAIPYIMVSFHIAGRSLKREKKKIGVNYSLVLYDANGCAVESFRFFVGKQGDIDWDGNDNMATVESGVINMDYVNKFHLHCDFSVVKRITISEIL